MHDAPRPASDEASPSAGPSPEPRSIRARAMTASYWTAISTFGARGLALAGNMLLTRLLLPEAFGLMTLVTAVLVLLQMLSDVGIEPAVVRSNRVGDARFLDTAWTLQIVRGLLVALLAALVAWPASMHYGHPELAWLVPVAALGTLLTGFNCTSLLVLNRQLAQRELTLRELASQAIALVVMVTWALVWPSVWALVAGGLARQTAMLVIGHRLGERRVHRLAWERPAVHEIVTFGKWIFLSSAVGIVAFQADRLLLGSLVTAEVLGVYSVAFLISNMPNELVNNLAQRVAFPALAHFVGGPRDVMRERMLRSRRPLVLGLAALVGLMAGFGDLAVRLLYDVRFVDAGWMLMVLALGLWPRMLANTSAPALLAVGHPSYFTVASALQLGWLVVGMPVGARILGLPGIVVVVALRDLISYVIEAWGLRKHGLSPLRQDLSATFVWLTTLGACALVRTAFGLDLPVSG